jgi:hypothetical protein
MQTSLAAVAMLNPLADIIYLSCKWRIYEILKFTHVNTHAPVTALVSITDWTPPPPHSQASVSPPLWFRVGTHYTLACGKGGRGSRFR